MPYRARRRGIFLGQVERLENPARGEDLEGPLGEAVHAQRRLIVMELVPEVIELAQERATARQALGRDRLVVQAQAQRRSGPACCSASLSPRSETA